MVRIKKYFFKILKKMLVKWVEWDFKAYIDSLEKYQLRKKIHNKLSFVEEGENGEKITSLIEYISSFVISMYSENDDIPNARNSMQEEAQYVTDRFIQAYKNSVVDKKYDLITYFALPNPKIENVELQKKVDTYQINRKENIAEIVDFLFDTFRKVGIGKKRKFLQPGIREYAVVLWSIIYECVADIKRYSYEYEVTYADTGEQRCLFNYFNLYIHQVLYTGKIQFSEDIKRIMFAAAALHPAEDDYIDRQDVTQETMELIQKKLLGQEIVSNDENLKPILKLIDVIYKMYPPQEHTELVTIFTKLHEWQVSSLKQKTKTKTEEELLKISFMKGGYAFAFYGYIAFGGLNIMQFRHFFGMGAIFQIMDDFHDIDEDQARKIETVWTKQILMGKELDTVLSGIIGVQVCFEQITSLIPEMHRPISFRRMELGAVRLDLVKFYMLNRKYFSDEIIKGIKMNFGIDIESYVSNYEIKLDQLKTLDEFQNALLEVKSSYIRNKIQK